MHHDSRLKLVIVRKMRFTHTDGDKQNPTRAHRSGCVDWRCNPGCLIPSSVFTWWTLQFISHDIDSSDIPGGFQCFEWNDGPHWGGILLQHLFARRLLCDPQAGCPADRRAALHLSHLVTICQLSAYTSTRHARRRPGGASHCRKEWKRAKTRLAQSCCRRAWNTSGELMVTPWNKRLPFFPFRGWCYDAMMNASALLSAMNYQTSQVWNCPRSF